MQQIADWLKKLGMFEYAQRFAENDIDISVLRLLTDQDLKEIGVSLGHRRKMLAAIADLAGAGPATPAPRTAIEPWSRDAAERRPLTVMFSDLVGSTALSARLDPEDLRGIITTYRRCCTELVERNGGFVAKYMGDGVLAYFGYPQAHEHDAERAVRAGLDLVQAVPKLGTTARLPLQVRVGIATGVVVVGDLIGTGAAQEWAVVGDTPNLAARLQTLADPGMVVIASSTRTLIGRLFEYRDLGTVALKGFAGAVPVSQVLGAGAAESRFEALRATTTPLVGREEEIELLLRRWEQAKRGEGAVVLISGEPGIGKSRVAQTVVERISPEPQTRLRYFCSPHHQDSALYPSITQLERAAGLQREDTAHQRLEKLEAVLARGTNSFSEVVPLLADLLSIPTGDRYQTPNLTPQKRKEKTLHAQLAQVEGLASRQPVLVVYEDVHWSDPTTRESLDLLIDRVPALRVLLIITFRPEFAPPWIGRPHVTMLHLNRLRSQRCAEMVAHTTGGKSLPKEIVDQIIDRTDGVPLFIEELTKTVLESGIVSAAGDRYVVNEPVLSLAIPMTLQESLLARLDRLVSAREVAQIAAALGRSFPHELISAVAQMPQHQVDDALEQLANAELIFRRGTPPEAEYTFKHTLVQDAAYGTLLRDRRRQLHTRIAATLESQFPGIVVAHPAVLAQHCAEAGLTEKSIGYRLKASQQAMGRSTMTVAVAQLQKGLDLLTNVPDNPWRRQQELDLLLALGRALIAAKGYAAPAVGETLARAYALAEQDRPDHLGPLLWGQWASQVVRSELGPALSVAKRIEQIGEAQDNLALRLLGHVAHGHTRFFLGEFVAARALFEQCHGLSDPARRPIYAAVTAEDPHARMSAYLAHALTSLGYIDQGRSRIDEALREARPLGLVYSLMPVLNRTAMIELATGSTDEAQRHAEEMLALAKEHGFSYWLAWGNVHLGWSLAALDQAPKGLSLITDGLAMYRATEAVLLTPWILMRLAEAHVRLGRPIEGLDCLVQATQIIETTDERADEAELHRVRGDLLNATGDRAGAEQSYDQALVVARRQSAKLLELRAATSLARLWRDQGKRPQARGLLAPIYGWFSEGFDTPVLQDARALLDQLT